MKSVLVRPCTPAVGYDSWRVSDGVTEVTYDNAIIDNTKPDTYACQTKLVLAMEGVKLS